MKFNLKPLTVEISFSSPRLRPRFWLKEGDRETYSWIGFRALGLYVDISEPGVAVCSQCGDTDIGERPCGDDSLTVCGSCRSVEQGYLYITEREAYRSGVL